MSNLSLLLENLHPEVTLTRREHALLTALLDGKHARTTLLADVFGWSPTFAMKATHKDTRCVDMLVSRLRKKVKSLGIIIASRRGHGYVVTTTN
jgi:DNA-binding response OmpR family regulator